jgi:hypothetical protein
MVYTFVDMNDNITDASSAVVTTSHVPQLSQAAHREYRKAVKEILEDLEEIEKRLLRVSKNLKIVVDKRLYFCEGYATFADFCQQKLGKSRQHVYALIRSYDVLQTLLNSGIAEDELPRSERICREIRKSTLDESEQAQVYKTLLRIKKQRGAQEVTVEDVKDAAKETLQGDGAAALMIRQQEELIQKFEGVNRTLRVGLKFDVLEPRYRRRLVVALTDIAETVQALIAAIKSPTIDDRGGV